MRRAVALALLVGALACGVKAPPRPPLREGADGGATGTSTSTSTATSTSTPTPTPTPNRDGGTP